MLISWVQCSCMRYSVKYYLCINGDRQCAQTVILLTRMNFAAGKECESQGVWYGSEDESSCVNPAKDMNRGDFRRTDEIGSDVQKNMGIRDSIGNEYNFDELLERLERGQEKFGNFQVSEERQKSNWNDHDPGVTYGSITIKIPEKHHTCHICTNHKLRNIRPSDITLEGLDKNQRKTVYFNKRGKLEEHYLKYFGLSIPTFQCGYCDYEGERFSANEICKDGKSQVSKGPSHLEKTDDDFTAIPKVNHSRSLFQEATSGRTQLSGGTCGSIINPKDPGGEEMIGGDKYKFNAVSESKTSEYGKMPSIPDKFILNEEKYQVKDASSDLTLPFLSKHSEEKPNENRLKEDSSVAENNYGNFDENINKSGGSGDEIQDRSIITPRIRNPGENSEASRCLGQDEKSIEKKPNDHELYQMDYEEESKDKFPAKTKSRFIFGSTDHEDGEKSEFSFDSIPCSVTPPKKLTASRSMELDVNGIMDDDDASEVSMKSIISNSYDIVQPEYEPIEKGEAKVIRKNREGKRMDKEYKNSARNIPDYAMLKPKVSEDNAIEEVANENKIKSALYIDKVHYNYRGKIPPDSTFDKGLMKYGKSELDFNTSPVSAIHISSDNLHLAVGTESGFMYVWKFSKIDTDSKPILDAPSPKNNMDNDFSARLDWGMLSSTPTTSVKAHDSCITSVHISSFEKNNGPISCVIVTVSVDAHVKVWALSKGDGQNTLSLVTESPLRDIPISAHTLLAKSPKIAIGYADGLVELWTFLTMDALKIKLPAERISMSKIGNGINVDFELSTVATSPSGNFLAIGSTSGFVALYETAAMKLVGTRVCRNKRGLYSSGRSVTGIEWNKKETMMCVTTLDSRIRLLATYNIKGKDLAYLEKFKGHKNYSKMFAGKFCGSKDEYIICPCERSFIYIWKHLKHSTKPSSPDFGVFKGTNERFIRFELPSKRLLPFIAIFDAGKWEHLKKTARDQEDRFGKFIETKYSRFSSWLSGFGISYEVVSTDFSKLNSKGGILLVASKNGREMQYSVIKTQLLEISQLPKLRYVSSYPKRKILTIPRWHMSKAH